jgi:hypothetical protein
MVCGGRYHHKTTYKYVLVSYSVVEVEQMTSRSLLPYERLPFYANPGCSCRDLRAIQPFRVGFSVLNRLPKVLQSWRLPSITSVRCE